MPPKTPNRDASTHSLLTPPPTDEHNPRRLARHPSSLSYRDDFEEHPKGRPMDVSGQSQTYGAAIDASGSYTQLVRRLLRSACIRYHQANLPYSRAPPLRRPESPT